MVKARGAGRLGTGGKWKIESGKWRQAGPNSSPSGGGWVGDFKNCNAPGKKPEQILRRGSWQCARNINARRQKKREDSSPNPVAPISHLLFPTSSALGALSAQPKPRRRLIIQAVPFRHQKKRRCRVAFIQRPPARILLQRINISAIISISNKHN